MYLTYDIERKTTQFRLGAQVLSVIWKLTHLNLSGFMPSLLKSQLNLFILITEGYQKHVSELRKEDAKKMLKSIKRIIRIYDKLDELLSSVEYTRDAELKERFKYFLKALYRLESMLHVAYTRDIPVEKTPEHIKMGLSNLSKFSIS